MYRVIRGLKGVEDGLSELVAAARRCFFTAKVSFCSL